MLTLKDIDNRVYDGKQCVSFQIHINDKNEEILEATFKRDKNSKDTWTMLVIFPRTKSKDSELYSFGYTVPRSDMKLELICAIGLRLLQLHLKEEIQQKSNLDFAIGEAIEGM